MNKTKLMALPVAAGLIAICAAGCSSASGPPGDDAIDDPTMTGSDAVTTCKKKVYVHLLSYGATDYGTLFGTKNGCWGLEAPKYAGGAKWSVCGYKAPGTPKGSTRWAYDDVNLGAQGHADVAGVKTCRSDNGGANDTVYVAASSGSGNDWSHAGVSGAARFFNECYDTDYANNRTSGCAANGVPMWNIGASKNAYADVLALCKSRGNGEWLGIYGASEAGAKLAGKEAEIVKALDDCTTR